MLLERERAAICAHARRLAPDGLAEGTSGNLSVRSGDLVAVTPSAVPYDELDPAAVVVVRLDGGVVEGRGRPSTEVPMHLAVYRATGAAAVVHTHSPWATAVSTVRDELPAIHYLLAFLGGPVPVAPYEIPGSAALGEQAARALARRSAVLLQNHGALTAGASIERAYWYAQVLEWTAALWARASLLGQPRVLSAEELAAAGDALSDYGVAQPPRPRP